MTTFNRDLQQENILNNIFFPMIFTDYLDKIWNMQSELIRFEDNSAMQYAGIDVHSVLENKSLNFDIKCQTNQYIGNPTDTFCLEISYLKNGTLKEGWFLSNNKTDYYLFVWITKASVKNFISDISEIDEVEFMLVYKKDLYRYLLHNNVTKSLLFETDERLRLSGNRSEYIGKAKDIKIVYTDKSVKEEEPINIVLHKKCYLSLPHTERFIYSKEEGFRYIPKP